MLTDVEINDLNNELESIILRIDKIERDYMKDGDLFSSEMVITQLRGKTPEVLKVEEASRYIFTFIDKYLQDHSATLVKGSLSVYRQLKVHLEAFEKHRKKRIVFAEIDPQFFESFENYLIQYRGIANTTMQKQLRTLKTFLGYAKRHKVPVNEDYRDYKIKREKLGVFALTKNDFDALYNLDLSNNARLRKVRDVFCFACVTGFRISDLRQLKRSHIMKDEIVLTTIKMKDIVRVPLTKYSQSILNIYADDILPLPVISAANMNLYLKELGKLAGLVTPTEKVRFKGVKRIVQEEPKFKFLTNHVARKTYVTVSLSLGMTAEEVMACSGHKDYKSFSRYVDITDDRKKLVMSKAWGEPGQVEN